MKNDFDKIILNKSDDELQEYIEKRSKFVPEILEAAIAEMQKRGRTFSNEELATIRHEYQQRKEIEEKQEKELWKRNSWKKNVVEDEKAPAYYSERAIYMFSVFFSVIFGAVLLANNLRNTELKKGVWEVISFGIIFTGLQIWLLSMIPRNSILTLVCSMAGALIMNYFFWKKYIGKDTKYRTKPIWRPLIIGIIIIIPIVLGIMYGGVEN